MASQQPPKKAVAIKYHTATLFSCPLSDKATTSKLKTRSREVGGDQRAASVEAHPPTLAGHPLRGTYHPVSPPSLPSGGGIRAYAAAGQGVGRPFLNPFLLLTARLLSPAWFRSTRPVGGKSGCTPVSRETEKAVTQASFYAKLRRGTARDKEENDLPALPTIPPMFYRYRLTGIAGRPTAKLHHNKSQKTVLN